MEPFQLQFSTLKSQPILLELQTWMKVYPGLTAGFTTRNGGVSTCHCHSLNCALHVADKQENVLHNRRLVATACGMSFDAWTCGEQVHGNLVHVVTAEERGKGRLQRNNAIPRADSLVTRISDVLLTSFYADCVPLFFLDPIQGVIGLAHAGWRGTVRNIGVMTIHKMQQQFGSQLEHIRVAIGPSIHSCCYEVDKHVRDKVQQVLTQCSAAKQLEHFIIRSTTCGRFMLNLQQLNRQLLIQAGISAMNIECTTWCTSCNPMMFFSYRKEGGKTGRMVSWIGWKKGYK